MEADREEAWNDMPKMMRFSMDKRSWDYAFTDGYSMGIKRGAAFYYSKQERDLRKAKRAKKGKL